MPLKSWYNVVYPREDLRENKPLDAAEFAVHLDQIRDHRARLDYQDPARFFERTYMTANLTGLAAEVVRRLSGEVTGSSAVFNMTTQFGGGKTHALALLYHLARNGPAAHSWPGVDKILAQAKVGGVPEAAVAVFVGTEFDSLRGRGGEDGTPLRRTPWGEIAYQLGGAKALDEVAKNEAQFIEPKGDAIRAFLPKDRPCLILLDEIVNYISTYRKRGYHTMLYNFVQSLSEVARGERNVALVVSIPASELEYSAEDEADQQRFQKMLDRLGKAVVMSAEQETAEIIRRRLFEWDPQALDGEGKVLLTRDALQTCNEYAAWTAEHRQMIPDWFAPDAARRAFAATYPFHPTVLSVFERKWQALPRFQRTRGILRLLALWVSNAYNAGFRGAQADPLIGLGTAPLDDPLFRAALFEQLGESRLEGAVTTDICGRPESHAVRLDQEAVDAIRKARLHRKAAAAILFESNGGQTAHYATGPEVRLALAEPGVDIGNVETVLEALRTSCYYLTVDGSRYRFSLVPNLNKILADRRASIAAAKIDERVRAEVMKVFDAGPKLPRRYFPENSGQVANQPVLTLVVLAPEHGMQDAATLPLVEQMTRQHGLTDRTFKSALVWAVADDAAPLRDAARSLLAWEDIRDQDAAGLDDVQRRQLNESLKKAEANLREAVWRAYKHLALLGKDNRMKTVDLGLIHSSQAGSIVELILDQLRRDGDVEESVGAGFVVRNWPGMVEWSTKAVRDAFFSAPQFPRLLDGESVKVTIARGVADKKLAYVTKAAGGGYAEFRYGEPMTAADVEISDDVYVITAAAAEEYKKSLERPAELVPVEPRPPVPGDTGTTAGGSAGGGPTPVVVPPVPPPVARTVTGLRWHGEVPAQKWTTLYMKVLTRFATGKGLRIKVDFEVTKDDGISEQSIAETRAALRELGLQDEIETSPNP